MRDLRAVLRTGCPGIWEPGPGSSRSITDAWKLLYIEDVLCHARNNHALPMVQEKPILVLISPVFKDLIAVLVYRVPPEDLD